MAQIKITYEDVPVGALEDSTVQITDKQSFSDLTLLKEDINFDKIANPCELNQTILDNTQTDLDLVNTDIALWTNSLTDSNCDFQNPPIITITFTQFFTSPGITFTFDPQNNLFCNVLTVSWYRNNELIETDDFEPNSAIYFCEKNVSLYDKIIVQFNSMNMPYSYLKLQRIDFGALREFTNSELAKVRIQEEISLISSELSINTLDFTINSSQNTDFVFQKKQKTKVKFDNDIIGTFFVSTSQRQSKSIWNVNCEDYVGLLDKITFYGGMYQNKNVFELATEILQNIPFEMSQSLQNKTVSGWLPIDSARNSLLNLAFAIGAVVSTARQNKIIIKELDSQAVQTFESTDIFTGDRFEIQDKATEIQLTEHNFAAATEETELFKDETGQNLLVQFSEPMHDLSIVNGSIVSSNANYAVINANVDCVLTGQKYLDSQKIISIKNQLITQSDPQKIITFSDCYLINSSNSQTIAQKIFDYYSDMQFGNIKLKAKDSTVGDKIEFPTSFMGDLQGAIEHLSFSLTGNEIVAEARVKIDE